VATPTASTEELLRGKVELEEQVQSKEADLYEAEKYLADAEKRAAEGQPGATADVARAREDINRLRAEISSGRSRLLALNDELLARSFEALQQELKKGNQRFAFTIVAVALGSLLCFIGVVWGKDIRKSFGRSQRNTADSPE
jgi:exonuclease VII large subunit